MSLTRSTDTPRFVDLPKYYLLGGPNVPPAPAAASTIARYTLEIPAFQRGIEWRGDQVSELLETKSSTLGTVILAGVTGRQLPILVDGLQRFAAATALLAEIYDPVLSQTPTNPLAAPAFGRLQAEATLFQPVFRFNSELMRTHPRRAISSSYELLRAEVHEIVEKELAPANYLQFASKVQRLFLDRQVGIDLYGGFSGYAELTSTFIDINNRGLDLSPVDLLRASLIERGMQNSWTPVDIQEAENDFTEVFERSPQAHLRTLGKYLNSCVDTPGRLPLTFPNWGILARPDVDALTDFIEASLDSIGTGRYPYLSEIHASGPQAFSLVLLHYWINNVGGRGKPDFAGGNMNSTNDCHLLLRAILRRLIDGTIFRLDGAIEWMLDRPSPVSAATLADQVIQGIPAGPISADPQRGWLEQSLRRADSQRSRRVFNACLLPSRGSVGGPFAPVAYGRGAGVWNVDHLYPQANQRRAGAGDSERDYLTNLAPLPASVNKSIRDLPCSIKLGPHGPYPAYVAKHPYVHWLVNVHYPSITPQAALDDQVSLAPHSTPPVGDSRIEALVGLLLPRL